MKVMPTLQGGLRIDAEGPRDWMLLRAIGLDAADGGGSDLAERLGEAMGGGEAGEDWREYVTPELREEFQDQLTRVMAAIENARRECGSGAGPLWIRREDGFPWYAALNQARLQLEEVHRFGNDELRSPDDIAALPRPRLEALLRSRFYLTLQSLLLDHVLD